MCKLYKKNETSLNSKTPITNKKSGLYATALSNSGCYNSHRLLQGASSTPCLQGFFFSFGTCPALLCICIIQVHPRLQKSTSAALLVHERAANDNVPGPHPNPPFHGSFSASLPPPTATLKVNTPLRTRYPNPWVPYTSPTRAPIHSGHPLHPNTLTLPILRHFHHLLILPSTRRIDNKNLLHPDSSHRLHVRFRFLASCVLVLAHNRRELAV